MSWVVNMPKPKTKPIASRYVDSEIQLVEDYRKLHDLKTQGNAVHKIVTEFLRGGVTVKPQIKPLEGATSEVQRPSHVSLCVEKSNPFIAKEVQRFMLGLDSPIIEGLFAIDEQSFKHSVVAGGKAGLAIFYPKTAHDIGATNEKENA